MCLNRNCFIKYLKSEKKRKYHLEVKTFGAYQQIKKRRCKTNCRQKQKNPSRKLANAKKTFIN